MGKTNDTVGFFKHEGGECKCNVCGASAPSACQIQHEPNCPVGRMKATRPFSSVEDRVNNLEHAMAELDSRIEQLNKLLKKLGADLTALDEPR